MWEQGDIALGSVSFIGYRPGLLLGGLSPPTFKRGGAQAPPAPPISPPLTVLTKKLLASISLSTIFSQGPATAATGEQRGGEVVLEIYYVRSVKCRSCRP